MEIKLISCPLCSHPHFSDIETLRITLVNLSTSRITCPVCSEIFFGLEKFTCHLFDHVNDTNGSKEILEKEIDKRIDSISESRKTEECVNTPPDEEIVKCDICNFSFTDRTILELHQKLLHQTCPDKTGTYNYHCHLCSKQFRMRGSLMVHLRIAHYGFVQSSIDHNELNNKICKNNRHSTQNINKTAHKSISSECKTITTQPQSDKKQWECDICSKSFTTKYFLKKHKRLHTGEMPYCCSLCNKNFTFQQSYHKHMLYHSSEKPYSCNECGRAFKELSTLQNHSRIHSGERPFTCETCGKNFRQRISYLVHRRIHTGVMPYKCNVCNKSFRYKVSQKSHKCSANNTESLKNIENNQSVTENTEKIPSETPNKISSTIPSKLPHMEAMMESIVEKKEETQKTSILLSFNPHIEITYNAADLESAIQNSLVNENVPDEELLTSDVSGSDGSALQPVNTTTAMSPIISNVEQLYLNSEPDVFFFNNTKNS